MLIKHGFAIKFYEKKGETYKFMYGHVCEKVGIGKKGSVNTLSRWLLPTHKEIAHSCMNETQS